MGNAVLQVFSSSMAAQQTLRKIKVQLDKQPAIFHIFELDDERLPVVLVLQTFGLCMLRLVEKVYPDGRRCPVNPPRGIVLSHLDGLSRHRFDGEEAELVVNGEPILRGAPVSRGGAVAVVSNSLAVLAEAIDCRHSLNINAVQLTQGYFKHRFILELGHSTI